MDVPLAIRDEEAVGKPPSVDTPQAGVRLFGVAIILGSFLLFQLELIFAKHILPWFGGTPAVWTTCMLFFQLTLLAGYGFAHWAAKRPPRRQAELQLLLVAVASLIFCLAVVKWHSPLTPEGQLRDILHSHPVLQILLVLTIAVGGPFLLLSTTAPVLQGWFRVGSAGASPYRLYALSNVGSLFGLISYPFVIEWLLPVQQQSWVWNTLFLLYALLYAVLCRKVRSWPEGEHGLVEQSSADRPGWGSYALWASLAACGSGMLLAVTNLVCEDVPVTPPLWVMPLCLYLVSFILAFDHPRWYKRKVFYPLYVAALLIALHLVRTGVYIDLLYRTDAYLFILFVICMICHGELARSKPAAKHLTSFYLVVSAGGVLGSVLVAIVAPRVFSGYWEFHIGLVVSGLLALCVLLIDKDSCVHSGLLWKGPVALAMLIVAAFLFCRSVSTQTVGREYFRDFFGVKQIYDRDGIRILRNGGVEHGAQYLDAARRTEPLMYYSRHSGVGKVLLHYPRPSDRGLRIGVVGLGTGAVAAYGRAGDTIRFWEIDPQVINMAQGPSARFSFLRDSLAKVDVVQGDGRLALEREQPASFDILVLDAFSGDAIPMHLLTQEAFRLYMSHLRTSKGVLAFHISSRIVDFTPVMLAFSRSERVPLRFYMGMQAEYAVFSRDPAVLDAIGPDDGYSWTDVDGVLWTDSHNNLLQVIRR